jgi:predicted tellurium resistance membrane protein TerC
MDLDSVLVVVLGIAMLITLYMTLMRLIFRHKYLSYDSWIFATCLALMLQVYDNHTTFHTKA